MVYGKLVLEDLSRVTAVWFHVNGVMVATGYESEVMVRDVFSFLVRSRVSGCPLRGIVLSMTGSISPLDC